jgi:hypothetical protein
MSSEEEFVKLIEDAIRYVFCETLSFKSRHSDASVLERISSAGLLVQVIDE